MINKETLKRTVVLCLAGALLLILTLIAACSGSGEDADTTHAQKPHITSYKSELLQAGETVQIPVAVLNSLGARHVKLESERLKRERDNQKKKANHLEWQLRDFRGSILARIGLKVHRLYRKIRYRN